MAESPLNNSSIINPYAPEAWMPYDGNSYTVYTASSMGILTVLVWDILSSLPDEIALLFQCKFTVATLSYCVARVAPLFFIAIHNTSLVHDVDHCAALAFSLSVFFTMIHTSAGLLFLLRVRALYNDMVGFKKAISSIWFVSVLCCILPFFGVLGDQVRPIRRCVTNVKPPFPAILFFVQAAYELLICAAVTFRICSSFAREDSRSSVWWSVHDGKSPFTRLRSRFLADSHAYFLITFFVKVLELIVYFAGNTALLLISSIIDNILISIMACKIHRQFRLGKAGVLGIEYESKAPADDTLNLEKATTSPMLPS